MGRSAAYFRVLVVIGGLVGLVSSLTACGRDGVTIQAVHHSANGRVCLKEYQYRFLMDKCGADCIEMGIYH